MVRDLAPPPLKHCVLSEVEAPPQANPPFNLVAKLQFGNEVKLMTNNNDSYAATNSFHFCTR
jgi:hypothetical protein